MDRNYLVVDLDSTIAKNKPDGTLGEPMPGARESLGRLRKLGLKVIIHSARYAGYWKDKNKEQEIDKLKAYLFKHKIPYDGIWPADKLSAFAYVDDRGVTYEGSWQAVEDRLKARLKKEMKK